jgi:alkanesulfonate monooxygenase SsuD/methylene tetrahydromethanopterin reductase-like flavin-dependent oxidoreductase (luciferase family)
VAHGPDAVRHKLEVVRRHCADVGRDYDAVLKTMDLYAILGDDREIKRIVADTARRTGKDEAFIRAWHPHVGDADRVAEIMTRYADAGIEYFIVNLPNAFEVGVISRFGEEVFPGLGLEAKKKPA